VYNINIILGMSESRRYLRPFSCFMRECFMPFMGFNGFLLVSTFKKRIPATQQLRDRMDKWDSIKLKSFCTIKEMLSKLKRSPTE
jgi:hypothetical protein